MIMTNPSLPLSCYPLSIPIYSLVRSSGLELPEDRRVSTLTVDGTSDVGTDVMTGISGRSLPSIRSLLDS